MNGTIKIGTGYDVHRLVEGRALWLGGVQIPFEKGSLAHSDGDVLLHAVCDALLGALALGDIGLHFPDTDLKYKDISSIHLLKKVWGLVQNKGYKLGNLDSTLILQEPKVSSFIPEMKQVIAGVLEANPDSISIKSTTTEGLGVVGKGEGIAAHAIVLLYKDA